MFKAQFGQKLLGKTALQLCMLMIILFNSTMCRNPWMNFGQGPSGALCMMIFLNLRPYIEINAWLTKYLHFETQLNIQNQTLISEFSQHCDGFYTEHLTILSNTWRGKQISWNYTCKRCHTTTFEQLSGAVGRKHPNGASYAIINVILYKISY